MGSRARRGAHLEAGGESGARRSRGAGVGWGGRWRAAGAASLGASYLRAGPSETELAAGEVAGGARTVWASGSAAPSPPRGSERGGPPRPDPAPGLPCPRGADPAPGPRPGGWGPDPAPTSFLGWSLPQPPGPAGPNLALPTFVGGQDPAPVPSLQFLLSSLSFPTLLTSPHPSPQRLAVFSLRQGIQEAADQGPFGDPEGPHALFVSPPPRSLPPGITLSPNL